MTREEALKKGREIRNEKILRNLYEQNKYTLNQDRHVSYEQFLNTVKDNIKNSPRYSGLSLVQGAKKYFRTRKFMTAEEIGVENIKSRLKELKTGEKRVWGREKTYAGTPWWVKGELKTKEETMYDVMRDLIGWNKRVDMFWSDTDKSYHILGKDGQEYALMIVPPSPFTYEWVAVNSARYDFLLQQYKEYIMSKGRKWHEENYSKY